MSFETKDSGKREQFTSGMVRDTQDGKTNFALVADGPLLKRWAELMTRGAVKYEKRNWMKAGGEAEYDRFRESAFRHFMQWYNGDIDEDHAAAVAFNINGAEYVNDKLDWQEESDCEAIERWNRVPLREIYEDKLKEATADLCAPATTFETSLCNERHKDGWICTLNPSHLGPHQAWGVRELHETWPNPTPSGPSVIGPFKTGMSAEMLREWVVPDGCNCDTCTDALMLRAAEISSTPVQVLNRDVRPVDEG